MKKIFIGGLGRSGTTICLNALYNHPDVCAIPIETKFLVEEDSFCELIRYLTTEFAPGLAEVTFERFNHMMRTLVPGKEPSKFMHQHVLSSDVFPTYHDALDRFIGFVLHRRAFDERGPLVAATRNFINETFGHLTIISDKKHWAEKTPGNIFRTEFLRELYPDCYIIHMIRNPVDIYCSSGDKGWLSQDVSGAIVNFEGYCRALARVRAKHRDDPRFIEVKMEDFVACPPRVMQELAVRLDITPYPDKAIDSVDNKIRTYEAQKVSRYFAGLEPSQVHLMNLVLQPWAAEFGYQTP